MIRQGGKKTDMHQNKIACRLYNQMEVAVMTMTAVNITPNSGTSLCFDSYSVIQRLTNFKIKAEGQSLAENNHGQNSNDCKE